MQAAFAGFATQLDARYAQQEKIYKAGRDITKLSKNAISLLHRCNNTGSSRDLTLLKAEQALAVDIPRQIASVTLLLQGSAEAYHRFARQRTGYVQEYVEAFSFYHFLLHGTEAHTKALTTHTHILSTLPAPFSLLSVLIKPSACLLPCV